MTTSDEHKAMGLGYGLGDKPLQQQPWGPAVEFGPPVPILTMDGKAFGLGQAETKQAADYGELLDAARARLAGDARDGDGDRDVDGDDAEEEDERVLPHSEFPTVGVDEQVVMEAPPESLTEDTRKEVLAAQLVAEARLPAPGPPRDLKVLFCVPYLKSTAEAYESISGRPVRTLVAGKAWYGHFNPNTGETWVDVGRHSGELIRNTLHELTHAWRERTPEARTMSAEQKEDEAWAWAEELLPEVLSLLNTPEEEW